MFATDCVRKVEVRWEARSLGRVSLSIFSRYTTESDLLVSLLDISSLRRSSIPSRRDPPTHDTLLSI